MSTGKTPLRAALYARVSTDRQSTENQLRELRQASERLGWTVAGEFVDRGISGAKGRKGRPQLDALLKGVARKDFDIVASWSVDRLGRSLILLCHKRRCRLSELQYGQCPRILARTALSFRRSVVMESATCR